MTTPAVEYLKFFEMEPERTPGLESYYARGQHFVIVYTRMQPGAVIERHCETEHFVILEPGEIAVWTTAGSATVSTRAAIIVPPGVSTVEARKPSVVVLVYAPPPPDLLAKCVNNAYYEKLDIAPFELWPEPKEGYKLRIYNFDDVPGPDFIRSRNIAVQWAPYRESQLGKVLGGTPHYHDDFEHTLLCMSGEYVFHMRYPWGRDIDAWREDEHVAMKPPSLTVVPPPVTHVPQAVGDRNSMLDISAPPRADLALGKTSSYPPNAAEYPFPEPS